MTYLPSIIAAVVAILGAFDTVITPFMAQHPQVVAIVAGLYAIMAHFLPSPTAPK